MITEQHVVSFNCSGDILSLTQLFPNWLNWCWIKVTPSLLLILHLHPPPLLSTVHLFISSPRPPSASPPQLWISHQVSSTEHDYSLLSLSQQLTGCWGVHSSTNYFTIRVNKNQIEHKSVCEEEQQTNRDRSWTFRLWPSADLHLTHTDRSWSILSPLTWSASNCLFVMVWTAEPLTGRLKASSTDSLTAVVYNAGQTERNWTQHIFTIHTETDRNMKQTVLFLCDVFFRSWCQTGSQQEDSAPRWSTRHTAGWRMIWKFQSVNKSHVLTQKADY